MAIQFALLALVILVLAGGAIDYANVATIRGTLQEAADAAVAASVAKTSPGVLAARNMTGDGTVADGQTDAVNVFNANITKLNKLYNITSSATITKSGLKVTSAMTYSINVPTSFLGIMGITTWPVSGSAQALTNLSPYIDFYLLLDNTPSMAIGATQQDIDNMVAATVPSSKYSSNRNNYITNNNNKNCAFACHDDSMGNDDFYNLAKSINVDKRIDVVRKATQQLTTTATNSETITSQFRMAVYTFGATAKNAGLTTVASLSSDLKSVANQAGAVDIMSVPYSNYNFDQQTDFDGVFSSMKGVLPTAGDGSNSSAPQEVLFFVSDGVADANYPSSCSQTTNNGRCIEPINTANCSAIKAKGVRIAVLYTTYIPMPKSDFYNNWVSPFQNQIGPTMQACASPGLYFEVSPTQGIADAMTALFNLSLQQVRITN